MALWILRGFFLAIAFGAGISIVSNVDENQQGYITASLLIVIASFIVIADILVRRKPVEIISCTYFGLIVGLFMTYIVGTAIDPILTYSQIENPEQFQGILRLMLAIPFCYICISVLIQTKHDFRFIIPYVEFAKDYKGVRPLILDTSVIIDGRIVDLIETNVLDGKLIMPRCVLLELQNIADSSDKIRRTRGRRGLDVLKQLQSHADVEMVIHEVENEKMKGQPVDMKLVLLAKELNGKLVTGDYNLNKVATLHDVQVINLNDIVNALKPIFLPGEQFSVKIVKEGEGDAQGVGYLDDGTMIVVEGGRKHLNETVLVSVSSVLQTSAGRLIFTNYDGED
ncbi:MAG: PIN domain-containing protein [Planctomycetota bacterium]|nr:PIN domain-containing protein [Planctomycetota bacterium]